MSRQIGPFEWKVLATIDRLGDEAWGSKLRVSLNKSLKRDVAIGQLYLTLSRLTRDEFISFEIMDPEPQRGGRSKKRFRLEATGRQALVRTVADVKDPVVLHPKENEHDECKRRPAEAA